MHHLETWLEQVLLQFNFEIQNKKAETFSFDLTYLNFGRHLLGNLNHKKDLKLLSLRKILEMASLFGKLSSRNNQGWLNW